MAEENKEGLDASQETPKETPAETITPEALKEQIRAELESQYKTEISTRDRKLSEYQKELKNKLTDEERIKLEAEEERKSFLNDYAEVAGEKVGLTKDELKFIKGSNREEIKQNIEEFDKLLKAKMSEKDKTIKKLEDELKIYKASGNPPPSGSPTVTATLQTQFNEAKKLNDLPMQMAIKRQAQREGFVINE